MEDLFRALVQGSGQPSGQDEAGSDPLSGLLQGLLGGGSALGSADSQGSAGAQGLDLTGLLQGLLGGGSGLGGGTGQQSGTGGGGMGGILGAIMGGGSSAGSDPIVASIANMLAGKLGLPPQIAQAVVVFVLGKLLGHRTQAGSGSTAIPQPASQGQAQGASLDGLLDRMNSGAKVRKADVRATGLAAELAAHTGMDRATAEASLMQVFNALGGQVGSGAPARTPRPPQDRGLDSLLDGFPR